MITDLKSIFIYLLHEPPFQYLENGLVHLFLEIIILRISLPHFPVHPRRDLFLERFPLY
jgi:hypothetical protein